LAALRHSVLSAGTACARPDAWRAGCPGRCTAVQPAAVARQTPRAVLCEAPTTGVLTPDTTRAPPLLPAPQTLPGSRLVAERGSSARGERRRVAIPGGCFLSRAQAGRQPHGRAADRAAGTRWRSRRNQPRNILPATCPQRPRVARLVAWQVAQPPLRLRRRLRGHGRTQACCSVLPTLPAKRSRLALLSRAYTGRGHGEGRLKEWQASAHLPAFDTTRGASGAGLLGAASAAAAWQRLLAHATPWSAGVSIATRQAAMGVTSVRGDLGQAFKTAPGAALHQALEHASTSLAGHGQRAHPQRDRHTGRFHRGREPLCGSNDTAAIREAA
jgi:hypothetical protein